MYEGPKWAAANWIPLNQNMWSKTKACITKSSCDICALLRYYAVYSDNSQSMFWDNLSVPTLSVNQKEWTQRDGS